MDDKTFTPKQQELYTGIGVFVALAVLTVIEYFLGVSHAPAIFLWAIALLKGGLVVWFFMHVKRFVIEEGAH